MQTLKTAAIVVLIMTVLYGAYVSLTTPPEPLPAEVESLLLVETGDLDIDTGLPSSMDAFEVDPGLAASTSNWNVQSDAAGPSLDLGGTSGVSGTVSDNVASLDPLSVSQGTSGPEMLPSVSDAAQASPEIDPSREYPSTASGFALPDPGAVAATFEASTENDAAASASLSDQSLAVLPAAMPLTKSGSAAPAADLEAASAADSAPNLGLANAIATADKQYKADQRKEALATLSLFYSTPNMAPSDREQLLSRLDALASEVVYSRRHLLEQPHRVGHNETLMEIAARYEVPWQLLANINGIEDPVTVLPGTELKVVRGPFRAEIALELNELTLFLGDLYAGRFPVAVGSDPTPKPGTYTIQDKQTSRTYYDAAGSPVPADSPNNPYGTVWMDLGGQICIHGSPERTRPSTAGCVSLAGDYAEDLYGILSQGSSVTIRR